MSSNYVFAFRPLPSAPKALPSAPKALPLPSALKALPSPTAQSDRFSLNRLMNFKATGSCRSCS